MPSVTIAAADYETFVDLADCNDYLNASASDAAASWRASDDDDAKGRGIVSATRLLDAQVWLGQKTDDYQPLSWPRSNTGVDGVDDNVVPQAIVDACCELAALYFVGDDVQPVDPLQTGTRRMKAGSVEIEYFLGVSAVGPFSQAIMALIGKYLGAASGVSAGSIASGVDECSAFKQDYGFNRGI